MRSAWVAPFVVPALFATVLGCADPKKQEQLAVDALTKVVPVAKAEIAQVRKGVPEGAKMMGEHVDADPGANLVSLQRVVHGARVNVEDLRTSKCSFFSFADATGMVLRSDVDPDNLAQRSLFKTFPDLKKALDPSAPTAEAWGDMEEIRVARTGPEHQWVLAHVVKDKAGETKGLFVTGWSLRRLAHHIDEVAKAELVKLAEKERKVKVPLVYAFLVKDGTAYGAPLAPDVNAKAVESLDLVNKTQGGVFRGHVEITNRLFGVAAERLPEMGENIVLSVIVSEV